MGRPVSGLMGASWPSSERCHSRQVNVVSSSLLCGSWTSEGWKPRPISSFEPIATVDCYAPTTCANLTEASRCYFSRSFSLSLSLYAPRWKILGTGSPSLLDRVRSFAKTKTTASRWGKKRRKSRLQWCYFFSVSIRTVFLMDVQAVSALSELRPPSTPTLTPAITTPTVTTEKLQ